MTCDGSMNQQELLTLVVCYLVDHNYCGDLTLRIQDLEPYRHLSMTSYLDSCGLLTLKLRTPEGAQLELERLQAMKEGDT